MPKRLIPLDWSEEDIEELSRFSPNSVQGAKIWWEQYTPAVYLYLLETLNLDPFSGRRDNVNPRDLLEAAENRDMSRRQRSLLLAGSLLFFLQGRHFTANGKMLSRRSIEQAGNRVLRRNTASTLDLCSRLRNGDISLGMWQMQMKNNIVYGHVSSALAAGGGLQSLDSGQIQYIQEQIKFQLSKLADFSAAIAGGMKMDGRICRIMKMYLNSARGTFHGIDMSVLANNGFTEYRNVLGANETHCTGSGSCVQVTDQGWAPVGSLTPIGARKCLSNCLCHWQYRNPFNGNVW